MSRLKGFNHTEETKRKMRDNHGGFHRPHTEHEKAKTSAAMREWHRTHRHPLKGKQASEETKLKMSLVRQGNKNANWKGGITELLRGIRRSPEYHQWRKAVLERDNHTCQDCGVTEGLNAHHTQSLFDYPEGIFEVDNGLTLCEDCHKRHTWWQGLRPKVKGGRSAKDKYRVG